MNFLRRKWVMDRRTFLRGTGVAIALPWLEAMGTHRTSYSKAGELAAGEIPARTVFTFWGMGMNPFTATPTQTGLDYVLPESIKPLEPLKRETTYFTGLHAVIGGFHLGIAPPDYVEHTVAELKALDPDVVLPMHCSGRAFVAQMAREMPERLVLSNTGSRFTFGV